MAAASNARRLRGDLEIVAFERGGRTSFSACGIPYLVAGEIDDVATLVARTPREFRESQRHRRAHRARGGARSTPSAARSRCVTVCATAPSASGSTTW